MVATVSRKQLPSSGKRGVYDRSCNAKSPDAHAGHGKWTAWAFSFRVKHRSFRGRPRPFLLPRLWWDGDD